MQAYVIIIALALSGFANAKGDEKIYGHELINLLQKARQLFQRINCTYDCDSLVLPMRTKHYERVDFAWDIAKDLTFTKATTFTGADRVDAVDVVVTAWDGSDHYHWERKVSGPVGSGYAPDGEPVDAGTAVRLNRSSRVPSEFETLLRPGEFGAKRIELSDGGEPVTVIPEDGQPLECVRIKTGGWEITVHRPTGLLVELKREWVAMKEVIRTSHFAKVGDGRLSFPTKVKRENIPTQGPKTTWVYLLTVSSIKLNDEAKMPALKFPPGTKIQDDITGTFRIVK